MQIERFGNMWLPRTLVCLAPLYWRCEYGTRSSLFISHLLIAACSHFADRAQFSYPHTGLSANDIASHDKWIQDINEVGKTNVQFPIIGDKDRKVATEYDMLDALDPTNVDAKGMPMTGELKCARGVGILFRLFEG